MNRLAHLSPYLFTWLLIGLLGLVTAGMGYAYFTNLSRWPRDTTVATLTNTTTATPLATSLNQDQSVPPGTLSIEEISQLVRSVVTLPVILDQLGVASASGITTQQLGELRPRRVLLFGDRVSTDAVNQLRTQFTSLSPQPSLIVDHEGGSVQRLSGDGFSALPSWNALCKLDRLELESTLASSAAQLRQAGIQMVLGPVLDLNASGSAMKTRSCSADPEQVVLAAQLYNQAFRSQGILTTLKHFPGIGTAQQDSHNISMTMTPRDADILPFWTLLESQPAQAVMMSHARIPGSNLQTPCSLSTACISRLTSEFPKVLVVSDALDMVGARMESESATRSAMLAERAVKAILAGEHLLTLGPKVTTTEWQTIVDHLTSEAQSSLYFRSKLQGAAAQVSQYLDPPPTNR